MSVDYYVHFERKPTDPEFETKLDAVRALEKAGVKRLPEELADYFGVQYARVEECELKLEAGCVNVAYDDGSNCSGVFRNHGEWYTELVVDLDDLPQEIRILRVRISS